MFGSSIAHRVVGGIFGSNSSSTSSTSSTSPQITQTAQTTQQDHLVNDNKINCKIDCDKLIKEYLQCIESASTEYSKCMIWYHFILKWYKSSLFEYIVFIKKYTYIS